MNYDQFVNVLNKHLFGEEKAVLLRKIVDNPERYTGLFRPTTPKLKILQNLLQSREIRFGNAFEEIIREFIKDWGFTDIPDKKFIYQGKNYDLDQYFTDGVTYYFIEQKVRDDHDSTKKRGQMANFKIKLEYLYMKHGENLVGIMYFIDPSLTKNKNYYQEELQGLSKKYSRVSLHLFYGKELFDYFNHSQDWDKLLDWLYQWKQQLPEFPEIDFDIDPDESFRQLKDVELRYWKKLLKEELWEQGIIKVISSEGETLNRIADYLISQQSIEAKKVGNELKRRISEYYSSTTNEV